MSLCLCVSVCVWFMHALRSEVLNSLVNYGHDYKVSDVGAKG